MSLLLPFFLLGVIYLVGKSLTSSSGIMEGLSVLRAIL